MLTYSDHYTSIPAMNTYFAGANTPKGFLGEYDNLMSEKVFDKIYILKGGPGTGKSTIIRKTAKAGEECMADITFLLCSSDTDSLDGVIIEKEGKKMAVIDGTAPHTKDPICGGACGEIINLGECWESSVLEKRKEEISSLIDKKSTYYSTAYNYLKAAENIALMQKELAIYCCDTEKMKKAVKLLCQKHPKGENGKITYRRTHAISMKGALRLESFEGAKHLFGVTDSAFISPLFFEMLSKELTERKTDAVISLSPVYGICELYVPLWDTAFVPFNKDKSYEKVVNLARFSVGERMGAVKQKRVFSSKCYTAMLEGALTELREAGKVHFKLEDIYVKAMDFEKADKIGDSLCENIRKRLS